jgi:hypothetical protein
VNATALGEYLDRVKAMRRVEEWLDANMQMALGDWGTFQSGEGQARMSSRILAVN